MLLFYTVFTVYRSNEALVSIKDFSFENKKEQ